jgi:hypothetical protein
MDNALEVAVNKARKAAGQFGCNVAVYRDPVADDPDRPYYIARPEINQEEDWGGVLVATVETDGANQRVVYENSQYL